MKKAFLTIFAVAIAACISLSAAPKNEKALVVYFSAQGRTEATALQIAKAASATVFKIEPAQPYSAADLNWRDDKSRTSKEKNDRTIRPEIKMAELNTADFDKIYLGFPIWWGTAPNIVNTFIETYGLDGKTVVVFATSGGSSITKAYSDLKAAYPNVKWISGGILNMPEDSDIKALLKK